MNATRKPDAGISEAMTSANDIGCQRGVVRGLSAASHLIHAAATTLPVGPERVRLMDLHRKLGVLMFRGDSAIAAIPLEALTAEFLERLIATPNSSLHLSRNRNRRPT